MSDLRIVICLAGLPGSGKTTLGRQLAKELSELGVFGPVIMLDRDVLKSTLKNDAIEEPVAAKVSYSLLWDIAKEFLVNQNFSLIIDTPCFFPQIVQNCEKLAESRNEKQLPTIVKCVLCATHYDLRLKRLQTRENMVSQWSSDRPRPKEEFEQLFSHLTLNNSFRLYFSQAEVFSETFAKLKEYLTTDGTQQVADLQTSIEFF